MTRSRTDDWSIARALAFMAATFAIVLGTLLPFGAMAAAQPGQPLVMCSAQGPQTVQVGANMDGPGGETHVAKCAACVMPMPGILPEPPLAEPCALPQPVAVATTIVASTAPPPPARAPPRPHSTAPPQA